MAKIRFHHLIFMFTLTLAPAAQAADASQCKEGVTGDDAISACTAYIDSKQHEGWDLAAAYLYRGKAFMDAGKLDEAAADLKQANTLRTPYPEGMAAQMFLKKKLADKANAAAAQAADPKDCREDADPEVLMPACTTYIEKGGHQGADLALAYALRGSSQQYLGKYPEALADFDAAIKTDGSFYRGYLARAGVKLRMKHEDEALADINKAIALKPDKADAYVMRAWAYYEPKKDFKNAVTDLEKALSLDPENQDIASALDYAKGQTGGN